MESFQAAASLPQPTASGAGQTKLESSQAQHPSRAINLVVVEPSQATASQHRRSSHSVGVGFRVRVERVRPRLLKMYTSLPPSDIEYTIPLPPPNGGICCAVYCCMSHVDIFFFLAVGLSVRTDDQVVDNSCGVEHLEGSDHIE